MGKTSLVSFAHVKFHCSKFTCWVIHKNVSKFAMMLHCSTTEFKQEEITFLNNNRIFCYNSEISKRVGYGCLKRTKSHTRTVVRQCCKGDEASQWRKPPPRPNPVSDRNTNRHRWLRRGPLYTCAKVSHDPPRRFVSAHAWLCAPKTLVFFRFLGSCNSLQPRPLNRFWRKIRQNTRFRARICLFGVAIMKSNI